MSSFALPYRRPRHKVAVLRLAVLAIAILTGGGAAYLATQATPTVVQVVQPPSIPTTEVLVSAGVIKVGSILHAADLRWQHWPLDGIDPTMVTRSAVPGAIKDFEGALVKTGLGLGEPMRQDRVIRNPAGGVMAAMLSPGYRALAINIDNRGASSAGGFILPNDRVDVIRVTKDEAATRARGGDVLLSDTILRNARVLAIGRNIQDPNGEHVSIGDTATLELTPKQVETVFLAQRTGQLTLALRGLQETETTSVIDDAPRKVNVRYAGTLAKQFNCGLTSCAEGR